MDIRYNWQICRVHFEILKHINLSDEVKGGNVLIEVEYNFVKI